MQAMQISFGLTHPLILGSGLVVLVVAFVVPAGIGVIGVIGVAKTLAQEATATAEGRVAADLDDSGRLRLDLDRGRPQRLPGGAARGGGGPLNRSSSNGNW